MVMLKNVCRTYELGKVQVQALQGVNIELKEGRFSSFVGPSGCGKTTLLNIIGCIDIPTKGEVFIKDKDIKKMRDNDLTEFRGKSIGFIFQSFNLIPVLNILENVAYPLTLARIPQKEIKERALQMIEYVGLLKWMKHKPNELSGGQRQRVAIARALVIRPIIVIADEPTANLDTKTSYRIMDIMKSLQKEFHTTFIFATHDPRFFDYVDEIYKMEDGRIIDIEKQGNNRE